MAEKEEALSPAQQQLELAYERNVLAAERNLMAWIRTSLTLIAFGFAIERFFFTNDSHMVQYNDLMFRDSGLVGLVLVVLGVVVINIAMFQHIHIQKNLEQRMNKRSNKWPLGLFTSVALQLIGILISVFIVSRIA
jgi:BASS family bile acid:Na+ symporter